MIEKQIPISAKKDLLGFTGCVAAVRKGDKQLQNMFPNSDLLVMCNQQELKYGDYVNIRYKNNDGLWVYKLALGVDERKNWGAPKGDSNSSAVLAVDDGNGMLKIIPTEDIDDAWRIVGYLDKSNNYHSLQV